MTIRQEIHFESGFLNVVATGEFSIESAKHAFAEMLGAIVQHRAEKVLVDGRLVHGTPEVMERFYYGEFAANETGRLARQHKISPRFAYVIRAPLRDPQRFGETVAVNRGMRVRTFETLEEASEWLTLRSEERQ